MKILDTNMILRILVDDNPEQTDQAENIINNNRVMILPEVVSEAVYVMSKVYKIGRDSIASALLNMLALDNVETNCGNVLHRGLQLYKDTSLDFVDCLLAAYHSEKNYDICTFDKKLQKLIDRIDSEK